MHNPIVDEGEEVGASIPGVRRSSWFEVLIVTTLSKLEEQDEMQMAFDMLHIEALDRIYRLSTKLAATATPAVESGIPQVIVQRQPLQAPEIAVNRAREQTCFKSTVAIFRFSAFNFNSSCV